MKYCVNIEFKGYWRTVVDASSENEAQQKALNEFCEGDLNEADAVEMKVDDVYKFGTHLF